MKLFIKFIQLTTVRSIKFHNSYEKLHPQNKLGYSVHFYNTLVKFPLRLNQDLIEYFKSINYRYTLPFFFCFQGLTKPSLLKDYNSYYIFVFFSTVGIISGDCSTCIYNKMLFICYCRAFTKTTSYLMLIHNIIIFFTCYFVVFIIKFHCNSINL